MKFKYSARNQEGEMQVGVVEAASRDAAASILNGHDIFILSLESAEKSSFVDRLSGFFNRVKSRDMVVFSRQLATLLEAKVPLADSLKNLYRQTSNKILKEVVFDINADVAAGISFSQALERHTSVFSDFFVNMVRAAEMTGRVDEAMSYLADYLEKEDVLTGKIKNALIYPAFVIGLFVLVVGIMVVYVFPQIKPIFEETGVALPIYTRMILGSGDFILTWWWAILAMVIIFLVVIIDYFGTEEGKTLINDLELRIPVVGDLFNKIYVTRFTQSASVLIKGGVSVVQAIRITARTIGNVVYEDELLKIADMVKEGQLLSRALEGSTYFPLLVANLTAIGESTGKLDQLLSKVADFYTRQIDDKVSNLVELIQPAMMVVIGLFVGILFASILMPIYNLAQAF